MPWSACSGLLAAAAIAGKANQHFEIIVDAQDL